MKPTNKCQLCDQPLPPTVDICRPCQADPDRFTLTALRQALDAAKQELHIAYAWLALLERKSPWPFLQTSCMRPAYPFWAWVYSHPWLPGGR